MKDQLKPFLIVSPVTVKAALKPSELFQKRAAFPKIAIPDVEMTITARMNVTYDTGYF